MTDIKFSWKRRFPVLPYLWCKPTSWGLDPAWTTSVTIFIVLKVLSAVTDMIRSSHLDWLREVMRLCTMSLCPLAAARTRALCLNWFLSRVSAPNSNKHFTHRTWPLADAWWIVKLLNILVEYSNCIYFYIVEGDN